MPVMALAVELDWWPFILEKIAKALRAKGTELVE